MTEPGPRLEPLPLGQWPKTMREATAPLTPPTPRPPGSPKGLNILGTFAHHPALATAWNLFNRHVLYESTISARERELLVLRVGWQRGSEYEFVQHTFAAVDAGIAVAEIERVKIGPDADGWSPLDAALLRAADELVADARIGEATWATLAAAYSEQQMLDIIFTAGCYEVLAMMIRSVGLELDADLIDRPREG